MQHDAHANEAMQACIANCEACHRICLQTASGHCLEIGGAHVEPAHFRLMLNCAEICQTSANLMSTHSAHHAAVCGVCAEICGACADSCESVGDMDACVEACRACARSCAAMSKSA